MPDRFAEQVRLAAETSVGRAVGFGALAIGCIVLGLAGYPVLALRSGAACTALMAAILLMKALQAPTRPFRRTEVWLLLDRPGSVAPRLAQRLIGQALRTTLERYAKWAAACAMGLWLASIVWAMIAT